MSDLLRKDPTRGQWVLVRPPVPGRAIGADCPFCPGNEGLTPPEIAAYRNGDAAADAPGWSVRVIPEADPYFRIELPIVREGIGVYDTISPRGATELIIESPRHEDTPATLGPAPWEQVLWMYAERLRDLKRDVAIRDILITRRYRKPGSRIAHPYSRLTAIPIIFDEVRRKLDEAREYYQYKRRCIYCDMVRQEVASGERVIHATDHFVAFVPYAARAPFELWILPRQHAAAYEESLSPARAPDLAAMLSGCFQALAERLGDPSVEMTLYGSPNRSARVLPGEWSTIADDYHWHVEITPKPERLNRVGGIYVSDTTPEAAAEHLRESPVLKLI